MLSTTHEVVVIMVKEGEVCDAVSRFVEGEMELFDMGMRDCYVLLWE